jgi:hypothetical protein
MLEYQIEPSSQEQLHDLFRARRNQAYNIATRINLTLAFDIKSSVIYNGDTNELAIHLVEWNEDSAYRRRLDAIRLHSRMLNQYPASYIADIGEERDQPNSVMIHEWKRHKPFFRTFLTEYLGSLLIKAALLCRHSYNQLDPNRRGNVETRYLTSLLPIGDQLLHRRLAPALFSMMYFEVLQRHIDDLVEEITADKMHPYTSCGDDCSNPKCRELKQYRAELATITLNE